jgi:hypothetical protein
MDRRIVDLTHQHELEQTRWQQQLNDTKQQLSASQSAQQASMAQYQTEKQEMIAKLQSVALAQREMQSQHQTEKQQLQDYWQQQSKEHLLSLQQQLEASVQQRLSAAQSEFDHQHQMILGAREQEWNQVFDELKHRAEEAEAKFEASQKAEVHLYFQFKIIELSFLSFIVCATAHHRCRRCQHRANRAGARFGAGLWFLMFASSCFHLQLNSVRRRFARSA